MIYYAFYGRPVAQKVYYSITIYSVMAAAGVLFDTGGGGGARCEHSAAGSFFLLGLSVMIPLFYGAGEMGLDRAINEIVFWLAPCQGIHPACWCMSIRWASARKTSPGRFDIWGPSQ